MRRLRTTNKTALLALVVASLALRLTLRTRDELAEYRAGASKTNKAEVIEQLSALNSLSYYVDGDWKIVSSNNKNSSLQVESVREGRSLRLLSLTVLEDDQPVEDDDDSQLKLLDPIYFVPRRLSPIDPHNQSATMTEADTIELDDGIRYHRFTSAEAKECLSNKRILHIGDSHMRNIWRAMNDLVQGNVIHDYRRWDGYQADATKSLPSYTPATADQYLPNSLFVRNNDHAKIGVPNACKLISEENRTLITTNKKISPADYWSCQSAKSVARQEHDLRTLHCDACDSYNITLDASWCASSLRNVLEHPTTGDGRNCRDAPGFKMSRAPEKRSQFEMITSQSYDLVMAGFHGHDIKRGVCKEMDMNDDFAACRQQMGEQLLQNAKDLASYCALLNIPLLWITSGPMNHQLIPQQYHQFQQPDDLDRERRAIASIMRQHGHFVLDTFHMANSCRQKEKETNSGNSSNGRLQKWPPCLSDGMHGSRFLDRMRAHMILNWQCPRHASAAEVAAI